MSKRPGKHPFNVELSDLSRDQLSQLATHLNCSRGQILRELIRYAFHHHFKAFPTCADGRACFVPQMHPAHAPLSGPDTGSDVASPPPPGVPSSGEG